MQSTLVMTVIGPDRPGLVESVATLVAMNGGNWLESRMSRLGGQFAGVLRIQIPAKQVGVLTQALRALDRNGVSVVIHRDEAVPKPGGTLQVLEFVGQDRPGIVHQITHTLASHNVNVEQLDSECMSAAMSGETLFKATAKVMIPPDCNRAALKPDLEKIAADLIVEITIQEVKPE